MSLQGTESTPEWNGWRRHYSRSQNAPYWFHKSTKKSLFEPDMLERFAAHEGELKKLIERDEIKRRGSAPPQERQGAERPGRKQYGHWKGWIRFKSSKGFYFWSHPTKKDTIIEEAFFKKYPEAQSSVSKEPDSAPPAKRPREAKGAVDLVRERRARMEAAMKSESGEFDFGIFFSGAEEELAADLASEAGAQGQLGEHHASGGDYMPSEPAGAYSASADGASYIPSGPGAGSDSAAAYLPAAADSASAYMPSAPDGDAASSYEAGDGSGGGDAGEYLPDAPAGAGSSYMPEAPADTDSGSYLVPPPTEDYTPSVPDEGGGGGSYMPDAPAGGGYAPDAPAGGDGGSAYLPGAPAGVDVDAYTPYGTPYPSALPTGLSDGASAYEAASSASEYTPSAAAETGVAGMGALGAASVLAYSASAYEAADDMGSYLPSPAAGGGGGAASGAASAAAAHASTALDSPYTAGSPFLSTGPASALGSGGALAAPQAQPTPANPSRTLPGSLDSSPGGGGEPPVAGVGPLPGASTMEAAKVAAGYNAHVSLNEGRKRSAVFHLFTYNNWVKNLLIRRFAMPKAPVLDCACGRGGDMHKWRASGTLAYVGLDIARTSLEEASRRHRMKRVQYPRWGIHSQILQLQHDVESLKKRRARIRSSEREAKRAVAKLDNDVSQSEEMASRKARLQESIESYEREVAEVKATIKQLEGQLSRVESEAQGTFGKPVARFICADASAQALYEAGRPLARTRFGTVSIQFALHYMFENAQRIHTFFDNASKLLVNNGKLIGTTPDADVLIKHVRNTPRSADGSVTFGNRFYRIHFSASSVDRIERAGSVMDTVGIPYSFMMEGAVPDLVEYLVPRQLLLHVAGKFNLRPQLVLNFQHFLRYHTDKTDDVRRTINTSIAMGRSYDSVNVPPLPKLPVADVDMYKDWLFEFEVLNWAGTIYPEHWEAAYLYTAFVFEKHGEPAPLAEGSDPLADESEVFDILNEAQEY